MNRGRTIAAGAVTALAITLTLLLVASVVAAGPSAQGPGGHQEDKPLLSLVSAGGSVGAQGVKPREGVAIRSALGTAFTYQGRLMRDGGPINDICDFRFSLWDAVGSGSPPSGGTQIGSPQTKTGVPVTEGLFTVQLNFDSGAFQGDARWLQVAVRCPTGVGGYATLSPRQPLTPAPYALALPGLWTRQHGTSPNLIGGYSGNIVVGGVVGAAIGGGGTAEASCGFSHNEPCANRVFDSYGAIGGGKGNLAGSDDGDAMTAAYATVGGGLNNTASSWAATIGGGELNTASGDSATVGGGVINIASGYNATVGGGYSNEAIGYMATIAGGSDNTADGNLAAVGGGANNTASGDYATVPGGSDNVAQGDYSFAAGRKARAYNRGCFVLADATDAYEDCINDNRFIFRVTNAFYIWTRADHTAGVLLPTGGSAWSSLSDRNVKANFAPVDGQEVLARLAEVPIQTWNYRSQDPSIRHMGPVAQDFYAAFGLGEDDKHISTVDADGVALAAIQGLYAQNREQAAQIEALEARMAELEAQNAELEARLAALEAQANGPARSRHLQGSLLPGAGALLLGLGTIWMTQRKGGAG